MSEWNYTRAEGDNDFAPIPAGDYRIRIASAEKVTAKTGKQMLTLKFDVSGQNSKLFHNIVFLPDRPEITNRNLTQFFDSFADIPESEFNLANWVGKVGACHVKHEEYNGSPQARVHYFIAKAKQANLPAWQEPSTGANAPIDASAPASIDDVIPFP